MALAKLKLELDIYKTQVELEKKLLLEMVEWKKNSGKFFWGRNRKIKLR